jgi:hypothetical protein
VLEAAALLAERRDAGEHVRDVGRREVPDAAHARDERRAAGQRGVRAGPARRVLEDAILPARAVAAGDAFVPGAHVGRDHRHVQIGKPERQDRQGVHQHRKPGDEAVLRQAHRRRVVDQEQDVDVPVRRKDRARKRDVVAAPVAAARPRGDQS